MRKNKLTAILLIMCMVFASAPVSVTKVMAADSRIESAIAWAIAIANDDNHGYSMQKRYGNPDYDSSSFVCYAFRNAGFDVSITDTTSMRRQFTGVGFQWIPWSRIGSVDNLKRGDILLNENSGKYGHTEIYLGNSRMIGAHGGNSDGKDGDSYGIEISEGAYTFNGNLGWHGVLRHPGASGYDPQGDSNSIKGGVGSVYIRGWAFDCDDPSKPGWGGF